MSATRQAQRQASQQVKRFRRRRVCFPVIAAMVLEARNADYRPMQLSRSPPRLSWQPTWLSSQPRVEHGVRVKDSAFSSASSRPAISCLRLPWKAWQPHGQPLSFWFSPPLLPPVPVVFVSAWPVSLGLLADASPVDGSFSLNSSAS